MHKINVKTKDAKYPIFIGNGSIKLLGKQIRFICPKTKKVALILDKNIPKEYKKRIKEQLKNYYVYTKEFLPSENLKSFKHINFFFENLLEKNFNRNDTIIAAGGGVIGDFAGFVSSILKRGLNFINLPSTLLSQVDSSIGGKTGVNNKYGKNLIGSFYQPRLVISDIALLKSLPKREIVCGYAEILKHALIKKSNFFNWLKINSNKLLKNGNPRLLQTAIFKSCKIKLHFVNKDLKEKNTRMILNFGHTFAHAIEALNKFSKKINHGEAVLIGMMLATKLSFKKRICSYKTLIDLINIYEKNNLNYKLSKFFKKNNYKRMVNFMINDKKNIDKKISFILLKKIGITTKPGSYRLNTSELKKVLPYII